MTNASWEALNPTVKFEVTTKQYFQKYCFKLVLFAPGGRAIYNKRLSIAESIQIRMSHVRNYNYGGSWRHASWSSHSKFINLANINLLEALKTIKQSYSKQIKFRVEEPFVQIYAENEKTLLDIASQLPAECKGNIESVSRPLSDNTKALLETGTILVNKPPEYPYRIALRDSRVPPETKKVILSYLKNLGEAVRLPKGPADWLSKPTQLMYNVYFYTNDKSIITFLNLIHPNCVRSINTLVFHEE